MELRRDEPGLEPRLRERDPARRRVRPAAVGASVEPADVEAAEVVREPLALPPARERHHHAVARAGQLLELGLGLLDPASLDVGGLRAERERLVLVDARQADPRAPGQRGVDLPGSTYRWWASRSWNAAHTSCQWSWSAGVTSSSPAIRISASAGASSRNGWKSSTGSSSVMSGRSASSSSAAISASSRCSSASSAAGATSTSSRVPQRPLGERREPPQRLDLVPEQVDADGPVLGRGEQVEQAAADRELAAVLDLIDALVSGRDQVASGLVEVQQLPRAQREAVGPERRIGDLLRQRHGADDDDRRLSGFAAIVDRARRAPRSAARPGAAAAPGATRR